MATRRNVIGNFESGIAYFPLVHCAGLYLIWVYSEIYAKSVQYPIIYTFYRSTYINPNNCDMIQNWKIRKSAAHTIFLFFPQDGSTAAGDGSRFHGYHGHRRGSRRTHEDIEHPEFIWTQCVVWREIPNILDRNDRIHLAEKWPDPLNVNNRIPWPEITGSPDRK